MDKVNNQGNSDHQDTDSGERVVTSIRTGMKREFVMMMRAQCEMGPFSEGRRRVTSSQCAGSSSKGYMRTDDKRDEKLKKEGSIAKSDLVGETIVVSTSSENGGEMASNTSQLKLETEMSKKVEWKKIPTKLKELLETGLLEGLRVRYIHGVRRRQSEEAVQREGVIQGTGILCSCEECRGEEVLTPNNFELHAKSKNKRPPEYLYLDNGKSLRDILNACKVDRIDSLEMVILNAIGHSNCMAPFCRNCKGLVPEAGAVRPTLLCDVCFELKTSDNTQMIGTDHRYMGKSSSNESDDLCSICEDGGNLLFCEDCYRGFHSECVGVLDLPEGKLCCKYCRNMSEQEKLEERDANAIRHNRIFGQIPSADISACAICRAHDFSKSEFNDRTIIICDQCEKEYHIGCLKEKNIDDLQALPDGEWFCSSSCRNINSTLQKLIEDGEQKLTKALFNLVMRKCAKQNPELDVKWRLLRGNKASQNARGWLSTAVSIFHDRFNPIADANNSNLDLISDMVYGSCFQDQDFCGTYCAILTVNSIAVCAATFRLFGEEVAELSLVATKSDCEGKGYFQALYYSIAELLIDLNVKVLLVPAADKAVSFWTKRFSFEKVSNEELNYYKRSYRMMAFEGTSVLRIPVFPVLKI